ncbi:Na+/H+ antiporter NhaA [Microbacterium sp. BWT-B31]|uniref:Na+/H+ antiporter NhaA n=1 Tax=Microbacterium sp. BWT-B31 TaxID=3232072 RepID=UPI00352927AF
MTPPDRPAAETARFPERGSGSEALRIGTLLRTEAVGGALLVLLAVVGIVWANSAWASGYFWLRDLEVGYEPWHLRLTLGEWAADGLLAIFFFLVGLELKREFVAGDLRRARTAIVPVLAAAGGVAVPALFYTLVTLHDPALLQGWAIPTATDIAFAVAVLAIIGSHLPSALRIFLLTLAVVDDLIAIAIIAFFYTDSIALVPLLLGLVTIAVYGFLAQRYRQLLHLKPGAAWLILLPLGLIAWGFVHASGIHATIAGVLLGFTIPVRHRRRDRIPDTEPGLAEVFEHRFRPISTGFAVPVFAFFSAGVALGGLAGVGAALADPVTLGIVVALVLGKPVGIVLTTWLVTRARHIGLDPSVRWIDLIGVGMLAGIGFTVSLLVTELSFEVADAHHDHAKVAILLASVLAAALASAVLVARNRRYRLIERQAAIEADGDGVPDVYGAH